MTLALAFGPVACSVTNGGLAGVSSWARGQQSAPVDQTPATDLAAGEAEELASIDIPGADLFLGHTGDMLTRYFGDPDMTRREGGAVVYQFKTNTAKGPCVLLAFLYQDRGDVPRIRHMDVRQDASPVGDEIACLGHLARAFKNQRTG